MPVHKIYASDLNRAHSTVIPLVAPRSSLQDPDKDPLSCPPIHTTPLISEQHFGIAEGKLWSAGPVSKKKRQQQQRRGISAHNDDDKRLLDPEDEVEVYETIRNRHDRFTSGESLDDLALRAEDAVERLVWPHLDDAIAIAHHHSDTGAGTNTNGVEAVEDGRPWENGEVDGEVEGGLGYHVVIVSHGLCISKLVAAILRRSANARVTTGV